MRSPTLQTEPTRQMFAWDSENSYNRETNLMEVTALPGHLAESPATTGDPGRVEASQQ